MVALKQEAKPPPIVFPEEYYMAERGEPTWPVSVNVVRLTLQRSDVATLHRPEIAIVDRSDYYGWARYQACVSLGVASRYKGQTLYNAVTFAFCEPLSDFEVEGIEEGLLIRFTLYVNRTAAIIRRDRLSMKWREWSKIFRA